MEQFAMDKASQLATLVSTEEQANQLRLQKAAAKKAQELDRSGMNAIRRAFKLGPKLSR